MNPYEPISCEFYDELEAYSIMKKEVEIFYEDESGNSVSTFGRIKDLFIRDKTEYLVLDTGKEIRLDNLIRVDNKLLADY
ncbi:MAG: hypothetical protein SFU98_18550 [Leptospiraceae bacterium]|nr:hypothetical protein [Leptospiraceae bacterium]